MGKRKSPRNKKRKRTASSTANSGSKNPLHKTRSKKISNSKKLSRSKKISNSKKLSSSKKKSTPSPKAPLKKLETQPNVPKNLPPTKKIPEKYKKDTRKVVLVCGVPATGKTTLSKKWCTKYGWDYISLNTLVISQKLYKKIDKKDGAKIVNLSALEKITNEKIGKSQKSIMVDGHLACEIHLNADLMLVLRMNPVELTNRLNARKYSKYKTEQNVKAEVLDYCTIVAEHNYQKEIVFEIDTTDKTQEQIMREAKKIIYPNKTKFRLIPKIDWSDFLLK